MSYCTQADIEQVFGVKNTAKWSDRDGDGDVAKIAARIVSAIGYAEGLVNGHLRRSRYRVPFTGAIDSLINDTSAKIAGVWLYENRGVEDTNPETGQPIHRLVFIKQSALRTLAGIRAGSLYLADTPVTTDVPASVPIVDSTPLSGVDEILVA